MHPTGAPPPRTHDPALEHAPPLSSHHPWSAHVSRRLRWQVCLQEVLQVISDNIYSLYLKEIKAKEDADAAAAAAVGAPAAATGGGCCLVL